MCCHSARIGSSGTSAAAHAAANARPLRRERRRELAVARGEVGDLRPGRILAEDRAELLAEHLVASGVDDVEPGRTRVGPRVVDELGCEVVERRGDDGTVARAQRRTAAADVDGVRIESGIGLHRTRRD